MFGPTSAEPMVIGSPPTSPRVQLQSNVAPSYLFGSHHNNQQLQQSPPQMYNRFSGPPTSPRAYGQSFGSVPAGNRLHNGFGSPPEFGSPNPFSSPHQQPQQGAPSGPMDPQHRVDVALKPRVGGPPTKSLASLMDEQTQRSSPLNLFGTPDLQNGSHSSLAREAMRRRGAGATVAANVPFGSSPRLGPARRQAPMSTHDTSELDRSLYPDECIDPCWITIFGFSKDDAKYILDQFSQYGTIVHHEISNEANWMHVRYQSKLQAIRALSKNTKIYDSRIQVGVVMCRDSDVIDRYNRVLDSSSSSPVPLVNGNCSTSTNISTHGFNNSFVDSPHVRTGSRLRNLNDSQLNDSQDQSFLAKTVGWFGWS